MFINMPTPKHHVLPVSHLRLLQTRQVPQYYYNQGPIFRQYAVQHIQELHHFSNPSVNHVYDDNGKKQSIDDLLKGKMKPPAFDPLFIHHFQRFNIMHLRGCNIIHFQGLQASPMFFKPIT